EAGRPGAGARSGRNVERPYRQRELDGGEPDRAGAQHRGGDHGGGEGRPLEEDHGGREGGNPRAEEHDQHDGGPAERVRLGSIAGGARGGHRREAGRPGAGARSGRNVEGPHRQRERHGGEPHGPGAQHRGGDHGGGEGRSLEEDHGGREGGNPRAEEHDQHDGGEAERVRLGSSAGGARGGHRREAGRPGAGARIGRNVEGPYRQRELDGGEPDRAGAQHRGGDHGGGEGRPLEED